MGGVPFGWQDKSNQSTAERSLNLYQYQGMRGAPPPVLDRRTGTLYASDLPIGGAPPPPPPPPPPHGSGSSSGLAPPSTVGNGPSTMLTASQEASTNGVTPPNENNYAYSSQYGGALSTEAQYQRMAGAAANGRAPLVGDPGYKTDQANANAVEGGYGNLTGYFGDQLSGRAPSLAQIQNQQATQQTLAAQQAAANSSRGPLANALAQRNAAQAGQATMLNQANQSVQARLQEQQLAAQGLSGALQGQGQFSLGEQGLNQDLGTTQAKLNEAQNALDQQGALAYAGMGQQTALAQAGEDQNYEAAKLQAQGMGVQNNQWQQQFNQNQSNAYLTGGIGLAGALLAADVKLKEPGGSSGFTIREEPDFLLLRNDRTGELSKIATQPLSAHEHRQAMGPHGAGPLIGSRPPPVAHDARGNLYASDLPMGGGDDASLMASMQQAAGPANAYGAYTPAPPPDAPTPDVNQIAQGMGMEQQKQGRTWQQALGGAMSGFARGYAGQSGAAPVHQDHAHDAHAQLMKTVARYAMQASQ